MIYNLYKQRGETPLERIQRFIADHPDLKGKKFTYLGRLDPMAEGVLLVGSGEDTTQARREEFFDLDKEYDFITLFGFATDTYDVLGKILRVEKVSNINELDLMKLCEVYDGEREQKYPEFSSKMIAKRKQAPPPNPLPKGEGESEEDIISPSLPPPSPPSRRGDGDEVKKITIYKMRFKGLDELKPKELFGRLLMDISKVKGDFRQAETLILWNKVLTGSKDDKIFLGRFSAHVSSGTYIRAIVNDLGKTLGIGATTLSIVRTRVGEHTIKDSIR